MAGGIPVRDDYLATDLRVFARRSRDAGQARRLIAIAAVLDGASRSHAAEIGGMDRQTLRDWVVRFNDEGPQGLINRTSPGAPPKLEAEHKAALAELVERGPDPAVDAVVRWRAVDLVAWVTKEFGIQVSDDTIYRTLHELGYSHISARPRAYAQDDKAMEDFKKNFPSKLAEIRANLAPGTWIEVWFQDEMRVGQKNKLTYRWAKKGSRPRANHDQRTQSAYIFGAVCPERGAGAAWVLPKCDTPAMQIHLDEISRNVAQDGHGVVVLDQAGWHTTGKLDVPENITLVALPPRAPELNPQENIWQYMRDNWLSNRVFESYDDIVERCCTAWRSLLADPERIRSIGKRDWALTGQSF